MSSCESDILEWSATFQSFFRGNSGTSCPSNLFKLLHLLLQLLCACGLGHRLQKTYFNHWALREFGVARTTSIVQRIMTHHGSNMLDPHWSLQHPRLRLHLNHPRPASSRAPLHGALHGARRSAIAIRGGSYGLALWPKVSQSVWVAVKHWWVHVYGCLW